MMFDNDQRQPHRAEPPWHSTPDGWATDRRVTTRPRFDARVAYGYDPDEDGSYHPDPEDYPPLAEDEDPAFVDPRAALTTALPNVSHEPLPTADPAAQRPATRGTRYLITLVVAVLGLFAAGLFSLQLLTTTEGDTNIGPAQQQPTATAPDPTADTASPTAEPSTPIDTTPTSDPQPPAAQQDDTDDEHDDE